MSTTKFFFEENKPKKNEKKRADKNQVKKKGGIGSLRDEKHSYERRKQIFERLLDGGGVEGKGSGRLTKREMRPHGFKTKLEQTIRSIPYSTDRST